MSSVILHFSFRLDEMRSPGTANRLAIGRDWFEPTSPLVMRRHLAEEIRNGASSDRISWPNLNLD